MKILIVVGEERHTGVSEVLSVNEDTPLGLEVSKGIALSTPTWDKVNVYRVPMGIKLTPEDYEKVFEAC